MSKSTKIYVGGTFDCFHTPGTSRSFGARVLADHVVVALNSDAFAESYKGRPVVRELERLEVLRACRHVDLVFLMESHEDQRRYLDLLRPDFILHGDDWTGDSLVRQLGVDDDFLRERGIEMRYVPYTPGISTTELRRRVVEDAERRQSADADLAAVTAAGAGATRAGR